MIRIPVSYDRGLVEVCFLENGLGELEDHLPKGCLDTIKALLSTGLHEGKVGTYHHIDCWITRTDVLRAQLLLLLHHPDQSDQLKTSSSAATSAVE